MPRAAGFDNESYLEDQSAEILRRVESNRGRLYLEFGGKLMYDHHAARVLPGYDPNVKVRLLERLRDRAEIILCIYSGDIERRKIRGDFGTTYDADSLMLIDGLVSRGIPLRGVVITRFDEHPSAVTFEKRLKRRGVEVYRHYYTRGYPTDVDLIVSEMGYGRNDYIPPTRELVVVTGPGPGSGKLATCLSQLYHDFRRGLSAGFAKFETFPIWNLPLSHPVNAAYEAATADLQDFNLVDPFHLEAFGRTAVNYNRDVDAFPLLRRILERITGDRSPYASPTEMGVNRVGFSIVDDAAVRLAAGQEMIRRFFRYSCEYVMGLADMDTVQRVKLLLNDHGLTPEDRPAVVPARKCALAERNGAGGENVIAAAIMLDDGTIVTGRRSRLMHAPAAAVLNSVKVLAGIPDGTHLLSPAIIDSIMKLKTAVGTTPLQLDLEEVLVALSVSAATFPPALEGMNALPGLRGCDAHMTHIPSSGDESGLRSLGVNVTCDPLFGSAGLFNG